MADKEFQALVKCTKELNDHIVATDLLSFTAALLASGLIEFGVKSGVDVLGTPQANANKIVEAMTLKVKAQASNFQKLITVLNDNGLSVLATILKDKLSVFCCCIATCIDKIIPSS